MITEVWIWPGKLAALTNLMSLLGLKIRTVFFVFFGGWTDRIQVESVNESEIFKRPRSLEGGIKPMMLVVGEPEGTFPLAPATGFRPVPRFIGRLLAPLPPQTPSSS